MLEFCVKPQQQSWVSSAPGSRIYCTEQSWKCLVSVQYNITTDIYCITQHGRIELFSLSLVAGAIHCHAVLVSSTEHRAACGGTELQGNQQHIWPCSASQGQVCSRQCCQGTLRAQRWAMDGANLHVYEILHYWAALHLLLCHSPVLGTLWF